MTTQDSTRTYAYHFAKVNDKTHRALSFNQDTNDFSSNFNKISFRYLAQCQQNQKRFSSPQPDLSKFSALPEKPSQPLKKYTFSILAKQQKPFRKSEDTDYVRTAALTPKYPLNMNKNLRNTQGVSEVENDQQAPLEKYAKQQFKKQTPIQNELVILRKERIKLQANIEQLKVENELFKVRFEQNNKIRSQQQEQIRRLKTQIEVAQLKIKELTLSLADMQGQKVLFQKQNEEVKQALEKMNMLRANCKVESTVTKQILLPLAKQQRCREQQVQTEPQNCCQKYKELISLMGLNYQKEDCHTKMVKQIQKITILSQENASLKAVYNEAQKQRSRLWHHLKKNQAQLMKICNLNAFLNSQIAKASVLISNCNQEINFLHLRELEQKIMIKYTSE